MECVSTLSTTRSVAGLAGAILSAVILSGGYCPACVAADNEAAGISGLEVEKYSLDLAVDLQKKTVAGTVTIDVIVTAPNGRDLPIDMGRELKALQVTVDGSAAEYRHGEDVLSVTMPAPKTGETAPAQHRIAIRYEGTPEPRYFSFEPLGDSAAAASYGLPYSARHWWPCFDTPAIKAKGAEIRVTVPRGLSVASNGVLVDTSDAGPEARTFFWREKFPIYADVIGVAIADYRKFSLSYTGNTGDVLPLEFFVAAADLEHAKTDFFILPGILRSYEEILGAYPFAGEKYGIAEFSKKSFREHQTLPSLGSNFITGRDENWWIIAHELAHQWFGNSVSVADWSDIWLNESFSQYAVALWQERKGGAAAYKAFLKTLWKEDYAGTVHVDDPHAFGKLFGDTTFGKGPWVLHMLRHVMGDEAFFAALKSYVTGNKYGHATTATWRSICERYYGKSLQWFFDEWVYGSGQPRLAMNWKRDEGVAGDYTVDIVQSQAGDDFAMPLDLRISTTRSAWSQTVQLTQRSQSFVIHSQDEVTRIELDPDDWVLKASPPR